MLGLLYFSGHLGQQPLSHRVLVDRRQLHFYLEVPIVPLALLVLVGVLSHVLVDGQHAVVDEGGVEPKVEQLLLLLLALIEFNFYVVVDKHLFGQSMQASISELLIRLLFFLHILHILLRLVEIRNEVNMRPIGNKLRLLMLERIIKQSIFAENFVRWYESSFLHYIWSSDDPYLIQLHHCRWHFEIHVDQS